MLNVAAINVNLNIVSAICGSLVLIILFLIGLYDHKLVDRVSIRFTAAISFVDVVKAVVLIVEIQINKNGPVCTMAGFSFQWLTLLYLFFNVAIAVNLQLVFINGLTFNPMWERGYWFVSCFMATILSIFPLLADQLGAGGAKSPCEYKHTAMVESCIWLSATFLIWLLLSIIYCSVTVVMTIVTLRHKVTVLDRVAGTYRHNNTQASEKAALVKSDIQQLIRRVALYCLIPVVTQFGYLLAKSFYCITGEMPLVVQFISLVGTDIPGILNFIGLLIDPAFENAIKVILRGPQCLQIKHFFVKQTQSPGCCSLAASKLNLSSERFEPLPSQNIGSPIELGSCFYPQPRDSIIADQHPTLEPQSLPPIPASPTSETHSVNPPPSPSRCSTHPSHRNSLHLPRYLGRQVRTYSLRQPISANDLWFHDNDLTDPRHYPFCHSIHQSSNFPFQNIENNPLIVTQEEVYQTHLNHFIKGL